MKHLDIVSHNSIRATTSSRRNSNVWRGGQTGFIDLLSDYHSVRSIGWTSKRTRYKSRGIADLLDQLLKQKTQVLNSSVLLGIILSVVLVLKSRYDSVIL